MVPQGLPHSCVRRPLAPPGHSTLEAGRKVLIQLSEVAGRRCGKSSDHHAGLRRERIQVRLRGGAQTPLHLVPVHGVAHSLGYDKTDLWWPVSPRILGEMNHHGRSSRAHAAAHRPFKIYGTAHAVRRGQHLLSGRELGAALATTGSQDGAAGAGAHTQPETVGLRTAPVVRLESPLAHEVLQERRGGTPSMSSTMQCYSWKRCSSASQPSVYPPRCVRGFAPVRARESTWNGCMTLRRGTPSGQTRAGTRRACHDMSCSSRYV